MLRKSQLSRPLLVLIALLMATLACYSDDPDPLGIFEFTPAPPSPTPLPPPDPSNPSKYVLTDALLCPRPIGGGASSCFVTDNPEELLPGVINARGSCEYNTELEALYSGRLDQQTVYYLIACGGTVGWINENRLMGPVQFARGESALTTSIDAINGPDGSLVFQIASQQPPTPGAMVNCQVNEVVDVLESAGDLQTGIIWSLIRCSAGSGWVDQSRLFGPLPLPSTGGLGMILPGESAATITTAPEAPTAENTVGECAQNTVITTNGIERIEDRAYYDINCGDLRGWVLDSYLIEILYRPDSLLLIEVPAPEVSAEVTVEGAEGEEAAPAEGEAETTDGTEPEGTGEDTAAQEVILIAPMTENAEFATGDNIIGECPTHSIVPLRQTTVVAGEFFYQLECTGITGWVYEGFVLAGVKHQLNTEVPIAEQGYVGDGAAAGFYISEEPSRLLSNRGSIGACKPNSTAQILDISFERAALGSGVTVYYFISCPNADETSEITELTGWVDQSRLFTPEELQSGPATDGLIGG